MTTVDFTDTVAIVTGAGRGLGQSHAEFLAARGASVVVNDIAGADAVAAEIVAGGGTAIASAADISTPDGAAAVIDAAMAAYGTVDILINNAGIGRFTTVGDVTVDEYELVRRVGLDGTFYMTRAAWPIFAAKGYGRIVITTSGNGLLGAAASASYAVAKAGVFGLMRAAAIDGAPLGIRVNSIGPMASTPMAEAFVSADVADFMRAEYPTSLVSPIVAVLASADCPTTGKHFDAGGGHVGTTFIATAPGYFDRAMTPESILANWSRVVDQSGAKQYDNAIESMEMIELAKQSTVTA